MKNRTLRLRMLLLTGAILSAQLSTPTLRAEDANTIELIKQLQKRIDELEQKVKTLEGQNAPPAAAPEPQGKPRLQELEKQVEDLKQHQELETKANEARAREMPKVTVGEQGFGLSSPNGSFALQIKGILQADTRTFFDDGGIVGNDGILLRRLRPILEGTVYRDFDFLFVPDFGGSTPQIFDAYLNYRYSPELQIQAGKFKVPVGLELLQADRDLIFNERALPTDLVPNRDLGFELHGDVFDGTLSYAAGIFNGVGDARNSSNADFEDDKAFAGRLFVQPFKTTSVYPLQGLGFGVGGSYEGMQAANTTALPATTGGTVGGFATVGQQQFFAYNPSSSAVVVASGDHWRVSPQGYYYYGPLSLMGEYVVSDQEVSRTATAPLKSAHLQNTAWQIAGGWVLTGEDAAFAGAPVPRRALSPATGGWGAWQLVARYSELDVDPATFPLFANPATSARAAHEWSAGLNWYLNRNVKLATSFAHTWYEGGGGAGTTAPASVTRKDENVLFTRLQLAF